MTYGEAYVAWSASHCRVVKETTMAAYALSRRHQYGTATYHQTDKDIEI